MRSQLSAVGPTVLLGAVLSCTDGLTTIAVIGAAPTSAVQHAERQLLSILHDEADGQSLNRREALKSIQAAESTAHHWQSGRLLHGDQWLEFESLPTSPASHELADYRRERPAKSLDAEEHRRLALWCKGHDLSVQSRVHWHAVLFTKPDDPQARTELGHAWIGDRWFTSEQLAEADHKSQQLMAQWEEWMPKMRKLVMQLQSKNAKTQEIALKDLQSIDDADAISSLEMTSVQVDGDLALPFLKAITRFRSREACQSLTRIALANIGNSLGDAAGSELQKYPQEFYVPELLQLLSSPTSIRSSLGFDGPGHLTLHQALFRETQDEQQAARLRRTVVVGKYAGHLDFIVNRGIVKYSPYNKPARRSLGPLRLIGQPFKHSSLLTGTVVRELNEASKEVASSVEASNRKESDLNHAIYHVLSRTTGEQLEHVPGAWWSWWLEANERYSTGLKPVRYYDDSQFMRSQISSGVYFTAKSVLSCLVRGTLVQTVDGLKAIEKIQIGDLVMSQNVESGELALKPVLQTTVRPPKATLRIVTDAGEIQATGGHRWWVPGKGWLKTRELVSGMTMHNATGTTLIKDVVEDPREQETYNLVVDGFHTYFVGEARVLSYDNTDVRPTLRTVPGYGVLARK